jgi:cell division protein FtsB
MKEFQEKKKIKKITHSKLFLAVLVFFIFILFNASRDLYHKRERVLFLKESADAEYAKIQEKNKILDEKIDSLETPYGVEKLVREKYNVIAPGEEVVIVLDREIEKDQIIIKKTSWENFIDFIKSLF